MLLRQRCHCLELCRELSERKKVKLSSEEARWLRENPDILEDSGEWEMSGADLSLHRRVVERVLSMPDRDDLIEVLSRRIAAGEYGPRGVEIAQMILRRLSDPG